MRRFVGFILVLFCAAAARAEQLPVRVYTTSDGLPRNLVNRIVQDPRGFLWLCTTEGLALFDGYAFTTYGTADGLPDAEVLDLLITSRGEYWVATRKGLARFQPGPARAGQPRFIAYVPGASRDEARVAHLEEDASGNLWCSTDNGVYRIVPGGGGVSFEQVPLDLPRSFPTVVTFHVDAGGLLWVATKNGLYRRSGGGRVDRFTKADGLPHNIVTALMDDGRGGLWVATDGGVSLVEQANRWAPGGESSGAAIRTWLQGTPVRTLFGASDGTTWVGLAAGLCRVTFTEGRGGAVLSTFTADNGLPPTAVEALAEDRQGNLWIGTSGGGAAKLSREGFVTYRLADGLRSLHITSIFESRAGDLYVTHAPNDGWVFRFDGSRFEATRPGFPPSTPFTWGWNQLVAETRTGEWWFASARGAWRFRPSSRLDGLSGIAPDAHIDRRAGMPSDDVFRVFEDRQGNLWFGTLGPNEGNAQTALARWERASGTVTQFPGTYGTATRFVEDRAGNVWIALYTGGLDRFRDGRFEHFAAAEGVPEGTIFDVHVDQAGRLWAANSRAGLVCIDDPAATRPRVRVYTTADGLSSNSIRCITEDRLGRIYAGTGKGVDRLDLANGANALRIRRYSTADGLAPGEPTVAFRDRHGAVWVGTVHGLSRLVPEPDRPGRPSPVRITGVQVEGVAQPVSAIGDTRLELPELAASENRLQFEFVGLGFAPGERLRYEYMLEGADREWSDAAESRRVNLAGLGPGGYRFRVRAVTADGLVSPQPAEVAFTIAPPLWRRWWVQAALALVVATAALALHKVRVARAVALERVRMQIATDLHDDIGSGLTRVAILSELAIRELGPKHPAVAGPLDRIAGLARDLAGSMGDIVWAVNPGKDHVSDLAQRMRRYASEVLDARNITLHFTGPGEDADRRIDPELRREVFLIFKEGLTNAVRHAACAAVWIDLSIEHGALMLRLRDDGKGFDPAVAAQGNGLRNMRHRARRAGGTLDLDARPGGGVEIRFTGSRRRGGGWLRGLPVLGGRRAGVGE